MVTRVRQAKRCKSCPKRGRNPGKWAMEGQEVCEDCGGKAPQTIAAARRRQLEQKARNQLARMGLPPVANALEALAEHAALVIAWRDKCAELVNVLNGEIRYSSPGQGLEQLRAEVGLLERAYDRATVTLSALARLNIDDRLAAIEQQKADMLAAALSAALLEGGVTGDQATEVRREFAARLRVLEGGKAA